MYGCLYVRGNTSYDGNGTGNGNTLYDRNGTGNGEIHGNGKRKWERNLQYTRLRPEHAYTFVCTRHLLRLSVGKLLGRMAFPLPPNTFPLRDMNPCRKSWKLVESSRRWSMLMSITFWVTSTKPMIRYSPLPFKRIKMVSHVHTVANSPVTKTSCIISTTIYHL